MPVADIMREEVVTADPDTSISEVATAMRDGTVGSVVVVEDERPIGLVTDRDIAIRVGADGLDPTAMTAEGTMTPSPVTVDAETGLYDLCSTMCDESVRRVPVTNDGHLVGIVTMDDVTVLLASELRDLATVIEAESPPY